YKDGHPNLAASLNNVGLVLQALGEPARALPYHERALAMQEKFYPADRFPDGHPELALNLNNLGLVLRAMGQPAPALPYCRKALAMTRKLVDREIAAAPEADALDFLASLPRPHDLYLCTALRLPHTAADSYERIWPTRAVLLRLLLRRHELAHVARLKSDAVRQ